MRINWFSPLPPSRTDIAHYTARILPDLSRCVEVSLWTHDARCGRLLRSYAKIRQYSPEDIVWREVESAEVTFYHIGNNGLFHRSIWQVSRRHPGIVVLHDTRLQQFFAHCFRAADDKNGYLAAMETYYGASGRRDAEAFWGGALSVDSLIERYPLTPLAIENALGVIVHTKPADAAVRKLGGAPSLCLPLPYPARWGRIDAGGVRPPKPASESGSGGRKTLIVFGYLHENRRLDTILRALAGFAGREQLGLEIYGEVANPEGLRSLISELDLHSTVKIHGFVPEAELDAALDRADLCLNLRYPSVGEASGSQLRIWDHSLPALVTRTGWYATLSEDVAGFVRVENEVPDLQDHFAALLSDPEKYARMGRRGRELLEKEHSPADYALSIEQASRTASSLRPRLAAVQLSDRVADEVAGWIFEPALDTAITRAAAEIMRAMGDAQARRATSVVS